MSIRDGVEPSPSPDSDTSAQPLPRSARDEAAPDPSETPTSQGAPSPTPADQSWPSRGQPPSSWGEPSAAPEAPTWTQGSGAQGPSWAQPAGPAGAASAPPGSWTEGVRAEPSGPDAGPSWTQADQTRPGWGEGGGGGYPTVPAWGERPAGAGSPRDRRPSRLLAAVVAGAVLLAGGYGLSEALNRDEPARAGIPVAAPAGSPAPAVTGSGEEPAAAVARALLPTVVEIRRGASGVGSGFVYDRNGYIMTAAHVVDGVDEVDVRLYDGTRLRGQVVGTDDLNDVGVVKVDRTGLAAAPLAVGQDLQVGQLAIAIGSPFGLAETVTAGIVSSTDRVLPDGREVIQTDAPINPGNSGGVLANRQGRVIGINSAIRPANEGSNGNVGIGFAVPIDLAAKSATAIVQGKEIQTGYLGVTPSLTTGGRDGALIQEVAPDSPAARAGLREGDLVVALGGRAVENYSEMVARIRAHQPGDEVAIGVTRGGSETTITATVAQRPAG
jgi:putative serine protease PepD